MSIIKHFEEAQCGSISVKTELGSGSTFSLMLPK